MLAGLTMHEALHLRLMLLERAQVAGLSPDDAEDVVQDVLVALAATKPPPRNPAGWCTQRVKWRAIDAHRRAKAHVQAHERLATEFAVLGDDVTISAPSPQDIDWDRQPLGEMSDLSLADLLGTSQRTVCRQRTKRGKPPYGRKKRSA